MSGNQSLWQITQAPAMLSAEPLVMRDAARLASGVREMVPHLEARVKAAFAKAKGGKVQVGGTGQGAGSRPCCCSSSSHSSRVRCCCQYRTCAHVPCIMLCYACRWWHWRDCVPAARMHTWHQGA